MADFAAPLRKENRRSSRGRQAFSSPAMRARIASLAWPARLHPLGSLGVAFKFRRGQPAIDLHTRVASHEVIASRLEELLLDRKPGLLTDPQLHFGDLRGDP